MPKIVSLQRTPKQRLPLFTQIHRIFKQLFQVYRINHPPFILLANLAIHEKLPEQAEKYRREDAKPFKIIRATFA